MKLRFSPRIIAIVTVLAAVLLYFHFSGKSSTTKFVTAEVTKGDIVRTVTATGTVNPVITVQVGSYVSGPIVALYADFNSAVKAGQQIAKIDPKPFQVKVDEAAAALANAKAQLGKDEADLAYKKVTFERNKKLLAEEVVSQDTVDSARSAADQAVAQVALDRANIKQQEANLEDAQVQLAYTNIVSPVDGTVVSRNVDVGQTVAASFQTPTLFLIAQDLTKMQVDSNVSESDIGDVKAGEKATFRVDAFPDHDFAGTVGQVRQAPITVQNVVTFDVVVNVDNAAQMLKPGMTANVTIITAQRDGVVRIPIDALRFSPPGKPAGEVNVLDSTGAAHQTRVWIPGGRGVRPVPVTIGLTDASWAELLDGNLQPGEKIVTDQVSTVPKAVGGGSPFMPHAPH
ncbi:MAG TPA: efflux RND transporter periplasmic adaptor subunit [Candidatus Binataceae bacterium]|nr:efflux RND transporter periplasmic adaptor subunit [Candidatus Binataceae bacterium]